MSQLFPEQVRLRDGSVLTLANAVPEDAESIIAFLNQAGGESDFLTFGKNECWQTVEAQRRMIDAAQKDQFELVLKGCLEGELVGLFTFFRSRRPRLFPIADLAVTVLAKNWNKGIGLAMTKSALRWAKGAGIRKINLRVRVDNVSAIAIYRKLGFVEEGTIARALYLNGEFYSEKFMGLSID